MKRNQKLAAAALAVAMLSTGSAFAAEQWMTGDWHQHSFFTDGTNFMGDVDMNTPANPQILNGPSVTDPKATFSTGTYKGVIPQGFRYGLTFQANSEHGGNRGSHDAFGRFWDDTNFYAAPPASTIPLLGTVANYSSACSFLTVDSPSCAAGNHQVMWRWQELMAGSTFGSYMTAFDWLTTLRGQYPEANGKYLLTGMEWNVPGHEHASTGCLENNGKCIAEFEYRFDQTDTDAAGATSTQSIAAGINWTGKIQTSAYVAPTYPDYSATLGLKPLHEKAIAGLKWANDNHPTTMWVNPGHIERAGCGTASDSGYSIAAMRDMNNTAPSIFFGFEGMPGHQKASNRGEISAASCGGGTYGGAGAYIATVGGVWDNLLADGRKIYNFVSSDFHMTRDDFYPGEYAKTYIKAKDATNKNGTFTQQDILNGMRSGNSYAVHGDLITDLDYTVSWKTPFGTKTVTMGEALPLAKGNTVTVKIKFKDGATNNNGDVAKVHHVQLIKGTMNPAARASKFLADGVTPNAAFNTVNPSVATVVGTFDANSPAWSYDAASGYTTITYNTTVQNDMFFRIRGTNLDYNISDPAYGTDANGNPLKNVPGSNSAAAAWKDLWFYSNPIFVNTTAPTQFVYTSDSHYGITRPAIFTGGPTAAQPVNQALVATVNALPAVTTPCDGGVNACANSVNTIDFVVNTGDIANRLEGTSGVTATTIWGQFTTDYINGIKVKDKNSAKASLFLVPGNHDVSNAIGYPKSPMTTASNMDTGTYLGIYNLMMKPGTMLTKADFVGATPSFATAAASYDAKRVYYSKNIGGVHFIFLGMWPDKDARTWMDTDLNSVSATTPVVLFTHDQPVLETKHLINPAGGRGVFNTTAPYKFENLVTGEGTNGLSSVSDTNGNTNIEQIALVNWLKNHKNVVAYFHGNTNYNEFYQYTGPNSDISLNTFRVDSPMKGEANPLDPTNPGSTVDPNKLSYQVISIDPAATQMTVREYLWNTKKWGAAKTVSLAPRAL